MINSNSFLNQCFKLLLAIIIGACLAIVFTSRPTRAISDNHDSEIMIDTITIYDTIEYSRFNARFNTYKLDLSEYSCTVPEYIFIDKNEVRDSLIDGIPKVVLDREFLVTNVQGVRIYHSGIASRIDSLSYTIPIKYTTTMRERRRRHNIGIGAGMNISNNLRMPIFIEYDYKITSWLSIGGKFEYDLMIKSIAAEGCAKIVFEW